MAEEVPHEDAPEPTETTTESSKKGSRVIENEVTED